MKNFTNAISFSLVIFCSASCSGVDLSSGDRWSDGAVNLEIERRLKERGVKNNTTNHGKRVLQEVVAEYNLEVPENKRIRCWYEGTRSSGSTAGTLKCFNDRQYRAFERNRDVGL